MCFAVGSDWQAEWRHHVFLCQARLPGGVEASCVTLPGGVEALCVFLPDQTRGWSGGIVCFAAALDWQVEALCLSLLGHTGRWNGGIVCFSARPDWQAEWRHCVFRCHARLAGGVGHCVFFCQTILAGIVESSPVSLPNHTGRCSGDIVCFSARPDWIAEWWHCVFLCLSRLNK